MQVLKLTGRNTRNEYAYLNDFGAISETYAGGSTDYTYGIHNIRKVFTLMLPGGGYNGFDIPPYDIRRTADIVVQGLREFARNARLTARQ